MKTVYRYTVPVDDRWHDLMLIGLLPPVLVAARHPDIVELWVEGLPSAVPTVPARLRVFGTGHSIPDDALWMGSCLAADGALVWHLYRKRP